VNTWTATSTAVPPLRDSTSPRLAGARALVAPLLLTVASGALYAAAFPPLALYPLGWLALAPLFFAVSRVPVLPAAGLGLLWALSAGCGTAGWLPGALAGYFDATPLESWIAFLAILLGLVGTYSAAFAAWLAWLARRGAPNPLVIAAGWVVCEFARNGGFVPSPWALSAYAQIEWISLVQIADFSGPWGVAFLIAWANACVAAFFVGALPSPRARRHLLGLAAALGAALVYGEWRLGQTFADGAEANVAIVQGGAARGAGDDGETTLVRYLDLTRQVAPGTSVILWPEGALDFDLYRLDARSLRVFALSRALESELLVSSPHRRTTRGEEHYFNSTFLLRQGRRAGTYDKVELTPFAETNPLRSLVPIGRDRYTPGRRVEILPGEDVAIGTAVCSEAMRSGHVRALVGAGAEVLWNPSNDGWLGSESASRQQLATAAFRAIESRRYLIRGAATGYSAIVDPKGRIVAQSGLGTSAVLTGTVRASEARSPYPHVGDLVAWAALLACLGASLMSLLKRSAVRDGQLEGAER
jgi:apolipoprotein N-acyltransferase